MDDAQVLRRASGHLFWNGWARGARQTKDDRNCLIGVLRRFSDSPKQYRRVACLIASELNLTSFPRIRLALWNDNQDSVYTVINLLDTVADKLTVDDMDVTLPIDNDWRDYYRQPGVKDSTLIS